MSDLEKDGATPAERGSFAESTVFRLSVASAVVRIGVMCVLFFMRYTGEE